MPGTISIGQDLWEKYGFSSNPFDTSPLTAVSSLLPIGEALVGRGMETKESQLLINVLRNKGGGRFLVEGDIGVGKTTFVNYHRFLWENYSRDRLFTTQSEIALIPQWHLSQFLVNVLSALVAKLLLQLGETRLNKVALFKQILALSRVLFNTSYTIEGSVMGLGGGFGKAENVNIPNLPEVQLLAYFHGMVEEIKKLGYAGLFLHLDNLELLNREDLRQAHSFFEEIRDTLQVRDVYFVFVANRGFFREVISPLPRVRSIFFGRPIVVPALTKVQVVDAIQRRYHLLSMVPDKFVPPVEESFIDYLHDLYGGRLRYIMDAMNMLLPEITMHEVRTVTCQEAKEILGHLVVEQVKEHLTPQEWQIFLFCSGQDHFSNSDISRHFQLPTSNTSRIMGRLGDLDLIYLSEKNGKRMLYRVSEFAKVVKDWTEEIPANASLLPAVAGKKTRFVTSRKQRLQQIAQLIRQQQEIESQDCVALAKVSPATASRDLQQLVQSGQVVVRTEGKKKYYRLREKS